MKPFFLIVLILTGCTLGGRYEVPPTTVPQEWKGPQEKIETPCVDNWWEIFQDEQLNELERLALSKNPTLDLAVQKVREARGTAVIAGAALYPQLTVNPSYTDTGELFKIFLPPGLAFPGSPLTNIKPFRIHTFQYVLTAALNYEVDLWGRLKNQYTSARRNLEATEFDYYSVILTLSSDIASTYFQLRALDTQMVSLAEAVQFGKKGLDLTERRFKKGITNFQDVANAEILLANSQQQYQEAERQRATTENMLAVLMGVPASNFTLAANPLIQSPPQIPAGVPSEILLRRPDIAEAERKSAAEHALIGSAYASLFPSLSLSGVLGFLSPDLEDFLKWKSRFWQFNANSSQSVFDGGRNAGNIEVAKARFLEASASYQELVLTAFQEVENALVNVRKEGEQYETLNRVVRAARKNVELSNQRYKSGLNNYLEVLINETNRVNDEVNSASHLGLQYVATVQLIKALGGGWNCCTKDGEE